MSASVRVTVEHGGTTYEGQIMRIEDTFLGREDHGHWTAYLQLTGGGSGQSTPAYAHDDYDVATKKRFGRAFGTDQVIAICRAVGVDQWEKLRGRQCLVLRESYSGPIKGIADLEANQVLIFAEHAHEFLVRDPGVSSD